MFFHPHAPNRGSGTITGAVNPNRRKEKSTPPPFPLKKATAALKKYPLNDQKNVKRCRKTVVDKTYDIQNAKSEKEKRSPPKSTNRNLATNLATRVGLLT